MLALIVAGRRLLAGDHGAGLDRRWLQLYLGR
jgi:hypothetical protein